METLQCQEQSSSECASLELIHVMLLDTSTGIILILL
jgi:hypothetical protein